MGIDISKENFHVFVILETGNAKRSFPNNASGFRQVLKWLDHRELSCVHACMEATGGFGDDLATTLYDAGHRVSIVTPKRIKSFGESEGLRTKTDAVDAALIARYCASQQPAPWEPPSPAERALQALVRRRDNLLEMRTQEANRVQAARTTGSVQKSIERHLQYLDESIAAIEAEINDHVDGDPSLREKRKLLTSIPGIADTTAHAILAEMPGIEHFRDAKAVGAFAGLSPRSVNRERGPAERGSVRWATHAYERPSIFRPSSGCGAIPSYALSRCASKRGGSAKWSSLRPSCASSSSLPTASSRAADPSVRSPPIDFQDDSSP